MEKEERAAAACSLAGSEVKGWLPDFFRGLSLADTADHLMSHLLGSKVHYGLTARPGGNILASRGSVLFS